MKLKIILCFFFSLSILKESSCRYYDPASTSDAMDTIRALKDTLVNLSEGSGNAFLKMHFTSMVSVIDSRTVLTKQDSSFLKKTYHAFNNEYDTANARLSSTYMKRQRPFILSWVSPTDGAVSFSWLNPPKDWDPEEEYPLYIQLHGLWSVASNSIEYMTYPFRGNASSDNSFEDGYLLSLWGRGNLWYQGISETDIWECQAALESIVKIDSLRKYLSGHSMGGFGAWSIAAQSTNTWAALGIHAGALWYDNRELVTSSIAESLKNVPTYFVCGTHDDLLGINQTAHDLLKDAGNSNLAFVTFEGGHDYIEENVENMYLWMRNFVKSDLNTGSKMTGIIPHDRLRIECNPNPVTANSKLVYSGTENTTVSIGIYDMVGRRVDEVEDAGEISGTNSVAFDAAGLTPGIYLVRMQSGHGVAESKITVLK